MQKPLFLFSLLMLHFTHCSALIQADSTHSISLALPLLSYEKPTRWGFLKNIPADFGSLAKAPTERKNALSLGLVGLTTGVLIWQDQHLLNGAKQLGSNLHLNPDTRYDVLLHVGGTKIIKLPKNLNTAFYQLGEGGTSMLVAGGLFVYGKIHHDYRSLQTASDLTETFISMGVATQLLKRSFGRQSPFVATKSGGEWTPFPAFVSYQQHTPNFDSFPSGHLATMMATVTVLSLNYPEKRWIKPLGYSLMGLTAFAMMNTEVHWAGDYPLALALGYLSGKITVGRHKKLKT
ncbi:MAG: phosphatase PAP2 family protein [Sphingobacteriaceae bacterium]